MSSLLSVLVNKDPSSSKIKLYLTTPKTVQKDLHSFDKGCTAFIETIADLDNAEFMTKWEMQSLTENLLGMKIALPPRDRLIAAKALAAALSYKQSGLPHASAVVGNQNHARTCAPQRQITPCKRGTKLAILVECLIKGSTMEQMMKATGWKEGGVLSGVNYDLNKRKGIGYSIIKIDGKDIYKLVVPVDFQGDLIV